MTDGRIVDAESILEAVDHRLGSAELPLLTEVIQVLPRESGTRGDVLLVDLTEPFLHAFDSIGTHVASYGRSGEGPLEFRTPWRATGTSGGDILIAAGRQILRIEMEPEPREVERFESPPNQVDLASVCGGWSSIVLAIPEGGSPGEQTFAPRRFDPSSREWRWLAPARSPRHPLAPVGRHARVLGNDSAFAVLNLFESTIEWRACDRTHPTRSIALQLPEDWNLGPVQTGAARLDDWLVFFWKSPVLAKFDGTHVSAWNPRTGEYVQRLIQDRELLVYQSGSSSRVFLVFNDLAPEVFEISGNDLARVLALPDSSTQGAL